MRRHERNAGATMRAGRASAVLCTTICCLAIGCSGGAEERPDEPAPPPEAAEPGTTSVVLPEGFPDLDGRILDPTHAPTPYTAGQIRAECRPGRVNSWSMVTPQGEFVSVMRFVSADETGTELQSLLLKPNGAQAGATEDTRGEWTELQSHASFPADRTRITSGSIELPAGTFDCWIYTITDAVNEQERITTYWFAKTLPGPPVQMRVMVGDERQLDMRLIQLSEG